MDIKVNDKLVHQGLQDTQYTITVRKEQFTFSHKTGSVNVITAKEFLQCDRSEQGCAGTIVTYYWGRTRMLCPWRKVRSFEGVRLGDLVSGLEDRVIFNISGTPSSLPSSCPPLSTFITQLDDIRLSTDDMEGVIPLAPYEVNLVDEIELTAEFLSLIHI